MNVIFMTREYPPHVYGGAGVHVEYLSREMARLAQVEVLCFGEQEVQTPTLRVRGFPGDDPMFEGNDDRAAGALKPLLTGLRFNAQPLRADIVHCHTWYSHWGGIVAKLAYGLPLIITVHSLEPLRPWKREQLGRGYDLSSWVERTALGLADRVIAVSRGERARILELFSLDPAKVVVVPNGIDPAEYERVEGGEARRRYGLPAGPFVLFVGRLSRQKGIHHFLEAVKLLPREVAAVLVAASPDSPEVERDVRAAVSELRRSRSNLVWVNEMVPRPLAIQLYSEASVFCCPSIYEPFGIINLEAMACETPVVASAVGGITEVVVDGETGLLVSTGPTKEPSGEPRDPSAFQSALARQITRLFEDEELRARLGAAGRRRVETHFGWSAIAERLKGIYVETIEQLVSQKDVTIQGESNIERM